MHRCFLLLLLLPSGCATGLTIPLFDRDPLVEAFPELEEKIHDVRDYEPAEETPEKRRWVRRDDRRLRAGDSFRLQVPDEPRLCREFRILPDGIVNLPMVGTLQTSGRSAGEIRRTIHTALEPFLLNPAVELFVPAADKNACHVVGRVRWPKEIPFGPSPPWLSGALTQAGRGLPGANLAQVIIVRTDPACAIVCNLLDASAPNPSLAGGDVVIMTRLYDPDLHPFAEEWKTIADFLAGRIDRAALVKALTPSPSTPESGILSP